MLIGRTICWKCSYRIVLHQLDLQRRWAFLHQSYLALIASLKSDQKPTVR